MSFRFGGSLPFLGISDILPRLVDGALPHLHTLTMSPNCDIEDVVALTDFNLFRGYRSHEDIFGREERCVGRALLEAVLELDFTTLLNSMTLRNPLFALYLIRDDPSEKYADARFDRETGRFKQGASCSRWQNDGAYEE